jgi:hypothetical protein
MIYKRIKNSTHIWNPESTLVFKNRKAIGRYVDNQIIVDKEVILICHKFNIQFDTTIEHLIQPQSIDHNVIDEIDEYQNHPAFREIQYEQKEKNTTIVSTDFIDIFTEEFKLKMTNKINELVYKVVDLESTLRNLNNDYENLLIENQSLKRELTKK